MTDGSDLWKRQPFYLTSSGEFSPSWQEGALKQLRVHCQEHEVASSSHGGKQEMESGVKEARLYLQRPTPATHFPEVL